MEYKCLKCPVFSDKLLKYLKESSKKDFDFEYWWNILRTKIKYFVRRYELKENELIIDAIAVYVIEKWCKHSEIDFPEIKKEVENKCKKGIF